MKTVLLYILAIVTLLLGGFIYLQLGSQASNPFRVDETGAPIITNSTDGEKLVFKNYGLAPEFKNITQWLNSDAQTMASLKGKVVLVNFWSHSCISCIRSLPQLNEWAKAYPGDLVIIGIHTPTYAFEKVTENVKNAIQRYGINYPVAQDNSYAMWDAYSNQFWPAVYLIDKEGKIVYTRFGEGNQNLIEDALRRLISLPGGLAVTEAAPAPIATKPSQKLLFGRKHITALSSNELPTSEEQVYTLPEILRRNAYALEGVWKLWPDKASLTQGFGRVRLNFNATKVRLTAQSIKPVKVRIKVDGKVTSEITIQALQDYEIFTAEKSAWHILELEIPQPGFEATAFIFD